MILSTLPDLPGRTYDVIGVVFSKAWLSRTKDDNDLGGMFYNIVQQASHMGADAIVDVKMVAPSGEYRMITVIGTAVKLR